MDTLLAEGLSQPRSPGENNPKDSLLFFVYFFCLSGWKHPNYHRKGRITHFLLEGAAGPEIRGSTWKKVSKRVESNTHTPPAHSFIHSLNTLQVICKLLLCTNYRLAKTVPERVALSSSRGSSQPGDGIHISCVSCIGRPILYHCITWEVIY